MWTYIVGGRRFWRRLGWVLLAACLLLCLLPPLRASWQYLLVGGARRIHPIYRVDTAERKVSLSFDACWGAERTPEILAVLRRHGVRTTFFLVNLWLEKYPEQARQIASEGHEIGLHSATHPRFTRLTDEQIVRELRENARLIREITGYQPRLFRPPFGDYDDRVIILVNQEGFIPVQWSIDSLDWKGLSAQAMLERIKKRMAPGSIILFHNNGEHTPETLDPLISHLKDAGYRIVPVSELIYHDHYYIDLEGVQRRAAE
mgnify:CR=1 FL=1